MITPQQIQTARSVAQDLETQLQQLREWIGSVDQLQQNNWIATVVAGGITVNFTFGTTEQNQLVANYQTMKTNISAKFGQLP